MVGVLVFCALMENGSVVRVRCNLHRSVGDAEDAGPLRGTRIFADSMVVMDVSFYVDFLRADREWFGGWSPMQLTP